MFKYDKETESFYKKGINKLYMKYDIDVNPEFQANLKAFQIKDFDKGGISLKVFHERMVDLCNRPTGDNFTYLPLREKDSTPLPEPLFEEEPIKSPKVTNAQQLDNKQSDRTL